MKELRIKKTKKKLTEFQKIMSELRKRIEAYFERFEVLEIEGGNFLVDMRGDTACYIDKDYNLMKGSPFMGFNEELEKHRDKGNNSQMIRLSEAGTEEVRRNLACGC